MSAMQMRREANILLLPQDLLSNISSWLDDRDICVMELANTNFHNAIRVSCGPPKARLNLGAPSKRDLDEALPTKAPPRLELSGRLLNLMSLTIFPLC